MSGYDARALRSAAAGPLAGRLPPRYLEEHGILPLELAADGYVTIAVSTPLEQTLQDELARLFGQPLRPIELPAGEIRAALLSTQHETAPAASGDDLQSLANAAPVITLVNSMLLDALGADASDVHIEPNREGIRVRFRLDGVLHDISRLPRQYESGIVSRIKIMAGLNIAERRQPQDGRARVRLNDREIDVRVSALPSLHGESLVLRILDHGAQALNLSDLGMPDQVAAQFQKLLAERNGIVLVTGPTGSGKTTTLYGALRGVSAAEVKVVTVEDPVEYSIEGVTQVPVNRKAGVTFASALRSILRHDPDVIMVGEMRDREAAEIAVQAALTGHLVFSTLHTNDAPSAITRLMNMGVEPYLVAATVQAIIAQRLVRRTCTDCRGAGCASCTQTGFKGRTGIFQLLAMNDELRELVVRHATEAEIRDAAQRCGMFTLLEAGMRKVAAGITTSDEIYRVQVSRD